MKLLGVPFPDPLTSVGRVVRGVAGVALVSAERLTGTRPSAVGRRTLWTCPGRVYVETHGVRGPAGARVARRIERALDGRPGVAWARVNAPTSRVVIALEHPLPRPAELAAVVARAEGEPESDDERLAEEGLHHPADGTTGTRLRSTVAVDAVGVVLAAINRLAPWAPLPTELAGLLSAVNMHPGLREVLGRRSGGHEKADSRLSMATALVHGLAARGEGSMLDIVTRVEQWREARAQERAWCEREAEMIEGPEHAGADPVVVERPRSLPESVVR